MVLKMNSNAAFICLVVFSFICFVSSSHPYKFYAGGTDGWVQNPKEGYNHWAERNRFLINDTLYFKYKKGTDSVLLVKKEDYYNCNTKDPLKKMEDGDSEFTFDHSGPFFFISGNPDHCQKGQKLIVAVLHERQPPSPPPTAQPPTTPAHPPSHHLPPRPHPHYPPTPSPKSPAPLTPPPHPIPPSHTPTYPPHISPGPATPTILPPSYAPVPATTPPPSYAPVPATTPPPSSAPVPATPPPHSLGPVPASSPTATPPSGAPGPSISPKASPPTIPSLSPSSPGGQSPSPSGNTPPSAQTPSPSGTPADVSSPQSATQSVAAVVAAPSLMVVAVCVLLGSLLIAF